MNVHASVTDPTGSMTAVVSQTTPADQKGSESVSANQYENVPVSGNTTPTSSAQSQNGISNVSTAEAKVSSSTTANETLHGTVRIFDDENRQVIQTYDVSGKAGEQVKSPAQQFITEKQDHGKFYDIKRDIPEGSKFTPNNLTWEIHVVQLNVHENKIFPHLRIFYKYSDDTAQNKDQSLLPEVYTSSDPNTLTLIEHYKTDPLTKKRVGGYSYSVPKQSFDWFPETRAISGYTAHTSDITIPSNFESYFLSPNFYVDVFVTYSPNLQKAKVYYVDDDDRQADGTAKVLSTDTLNGNSDKFINQDGKARIQTTINDYLNQHYQLSPNSTDIDGFTFDHDDNQDQTIYVHLKHATSSVSKTVKNTVHYVMSDGSQAPADHVQDLNFNGTKDEVTGQITWDAQPQTFDAVTVPAISGYTPDQTIVNGATVSHDSGDIQTTVTYNKDVVPNKPDTPNPPTDPKQDPSTTPSTPSTKPTTHSTKPSANPSTVTSLPASATPAKQELPQTGNQEKQATGVWGLALATIGFLLGSGYKRKKN